MQVDSSTYSQFLLSGIHYQSSLGVSKYWYTEFQGMGPYHYSYSYKGPHCKVPGMTYSNDLDFQQKSHRNLSRRRYCQCNRTRQNKQYFAHRYAQHQYHHYNMRQHQVLL